MTGKMTTGDLKVGIHQVVIKDANGKVKRNNPVSSPLRLFTIRCLTCETIVQGRGVDADAVLDSPNLKGWGFGSGGAYCAECFGKMLAYIKHERKQAGTQNGTGRQEKEIENEC